MTQLPYYWGYLSANEASEVLKASYTYTLSYKIHAQLQSSASAALASAAVKAKHLAGVDERKIKSLMGQNQEMTGAPPGNIVMNKPRVPGVKQGMNRSQTQQSQATEEEKEEVEEEETFEEDFYSLFTY